MPAQHVAGGSLPRCARCAMFRGNGLETPSVRNVVQVPEHVLEFPELLQERAHLAIPIKRGEKLGRVPKLL